MKYISAIQQAEADGTTIRALGSGWSFSDAVIPQEKPLSWAQIAGSPFFGLPESAFGYAILPSNYNRSLQSMLAQLLLPEVDPSSLFFVEAGITLTDLNILLNSQSPPVALATLGGSSGQTLAGAISTGTHGSDFDCPPLADYVQAIYLIGAGGTHHWIERSNAITYATKETLFPCISAGNCHYSTDMFLDTVVSMGCMGVIYAVILKVVPQYVLTQFNLWSTWEELNAQVGALSNVASGAMFPDLTEFILNSAYSKNRALEVVVNPISNDDGTHNCYATIRYEMPLSAAAPSLMLPSGVQPGNLSTVVEDGSADLVNAMTSGPDSQNSGIQFNLWWASTFGQIENNPNDPVGTMNSIISFCEYHGYAFAVRAAIDLILQTTFPQYQTASSAPGPQIDLGYKVMSGSNVYGISFSPFQVVSMEAAFSFEGAITYVNAALELIDATVAQGIYPGGYVSLRACGPTRASMGMQQYGSGYVFQTLQGWWRYH